MARLAVSGEQSIYYEHYAGSGPAVLLSHGWGMNCRAWDDVIAHLQDQGRAVVAYDQRACGRSDKDFADVSIEALGADVAALVDHLGLDAVVLNGWSLGGAVVVDAATRLGEKLAGLVLTCGATPRYTQADDYPHGGTPDDVAGTVAALRADRVNFLHGLYFEGVFAKPVSEAVKQNAWQLALQASPAADASLGALAHIDQRAALAALSQPVLVFAGAEDGVVTPDIPRSAAALCQQGTLVEMAGCGHAPFAEDSAAYFAALDAFLADLTA